MLMALGDYNDYDAGINYGPLDPALFVVIPRYGNPTYEEQRYNPAHYVETDVAINPAIVNQASARVVEFGVYEEYLAGSGDREIDAALMFGVRLRNMDPTYEAQKESQAHIVEADVAIHPIVDNQASADGGVTEFSEDSQRQPSVVLQEQTA